MSKYIYEEPKQQAESSVSYMRRSHQIIWWNSSWRNVPQSFHHVSESQQRSASRREISREEWVNPPVVRKVMLFPWAGRSRKYSVSENSCGVRPHQHWGIHIENNSLQHAICHVPAPVLHNREATRKKSVIKTRNMLTKGENVARQSTGEIIHWNLLHCLPVDCPLRASLPTLD